MAFGRHSKKGQSSKANGGSISPRLSAFNEDELLIVGSLAAKFGEEVALYIFQRPIPAPSRERTAQDFKAAVGLVREIDEHLRATGAREADAVIPPPPEVIDVFVDAIRKGDTPGDISGRLKKHENHAFFKQEIPVR